MQQVLLCGPHFETFTISVMSVSGTLVEHFALFDEAQRAWNLRQTSTFIWQRRTFRTSTFPNRSSRSRVWIAIRAGL
jgi:hypothetical protein